MDLPTNSDTAVMDAHADLEAPCSTARLLDEVGDLGRYPQWLDLVYRAQPVHESATPTWDVELRARVGPLARSKRLRMVRTVYDESTGRVVFERREADGRHHSPWTLQAQVTQTAQGSSLHMHLHYGGTLWTGGVLERVLADQITNGRQRLLQVLQQKR
jgi:hypothetical protein